MKLNIIQIAKAIEVLARLMYIADVADQTFNSGTQTNNLSENLGNNPFAAFNSSEMALFKKDSQNFLGKLQTSLLNETTVDTAKLTEFVSLEKTFAQHPAMASAFIPTSNQPKFDDIFTKGFLNNAFPKPPRLYLESILHGDVLNNLFGEQETSTDNDNTHHHGRDTAGGGGTNPLTNSPVSNQPTLPPTTGKPSPEPTTSQPSTPPTIKPTNDPTKQPTSQPSGQPTTSEPSTAPSKAPTPPTKNPTNMPSSAPAEITDNPSQAPTASNPTKSPTKVPSEKPSKAPTESKPTPTPSESPSQAPTASNPTKSPTKVPSEKPSQAPTESKPTPTPSESPSQAPTASNPTKSPTETPSTPPSQAPTESKPTHNPTNHPSQTPTKNPTNSMPTNNPSVTQPTQSPTKAPTYNLEDVAQRVGEVMDSTQYAQSLNAIDGFGLSKNATIKLTEAVISRFGALSNTTSPTQTPSSPPSTQNTTAPSSLRPTTLTPSKSPTKEALFKAPTPQPTTGQPTTNKPTTKTPTSLPSTAPNSAKPSTAPSSSPTDYKHSTDGTLTEWNNAANTTQYKQLSEQKKLELALTMAGNLDVAGAEKALTVLCQKMTAFRSDDANANLDISIYDRIIEMCNRAFDVIYGSQTNSPSNAPTQLSTTSSAPSTAHPAPETTGSVSSSTTDNISNFAAFTVLGVGALAGAVMATMIIAATRKIVAQARQASSSSKAKITEGSPHQYKDFIKELETFVNNQESNWINNPVKITNEFLEILKNGPKVDGLELPKAIGEDRYRINPLGYREVANKVTEYFNHPNVAKDLGSTPAPTAKNPIFNSMFSKIGGARGGGTTI